VLLGGIVALALAVHLVGIRKEAVPRGQLLQAFAPSATSRGPMIRIYRIAPAPAVPP